MVAIDFGRVRRGAIPQLFSRVPVWQGIGGMPPTLLVLAGIVSVQVGAALATELFAATGPAGAVSLRLFFAGVVLLVFWRSSLRIERRALPVVLGYGAVLALMNLSFYEAIDRIPLGMAVTLEFLGPLAVALAGSRRWIDPVWAVLAGAGVLLLTRAAGHVPWLGVLLALGAATCWAGYILLGAKLGEKTSGGGGLAVAMAFGGVLMAPVGIAGAGTALLHPSVLAAGFGVAMLSSVLPYSVELEALRRIPPRVFGVLMSLEPAVAAMAGLLVLGQQMSLPQWGGIACVVAASAGATRTGRGDHV
ncbi:EamA family transporter [Nocardia miyunensis]|uniref:EamA family transporter n=1 Tax=Nocardia miyunensis TaxID=282684 RepID=UPI000A419216|nr:EamA family transporter [Nocardia miyunensis]